MHSIHLIYSVLTFSFVSGFGAHLVQPTGIPSAVFPRQSLQVSAYVKTYPGKQLEHLAEVNGLELASFGTKSVSLVILLITLHLFTLSTQTFNNS